MSKNSNSFANLLGVKIISYRELLYFGEPGAAPPKY